MRHRFAFRYLQVPYTLLESRIVNAIRGTVREAEEGEDAAPAGSTTSSGPVEGSRGGGEEGGTDEKGSVDEAFSSTSSSRDGAGHRSPMEGEGGRRDGLDTSALGTSRLPCAIAVGLFFVGRVCVRREGGPPWRSSFVATTASSSISRWGRR